MADEDKKHKKDDPLVGALKEHPEGAIAVGLMKSRMPWWKRLLLLFLVGVIFGVGFYLKHLFEKSGGGSSSSNVVTSNTVNAPLTVQGNNSSNSTTVMRKHGLLNGPVSP